MHPDADDQPTPPSSHRLAPIGGIALVLGIVGLIFVFNTDSKTEQSTVITSPSGSAVATPFPRATTPAAPTPTASPTFPSASNNQETNETKFLTIESQVAHHWSWYTPESQRGGFPATEAARIEEDRRLKLFEFGQTCNWLENSKAGYSESARRSGLGAGYTSANFEIYLKGCGDENLEYLPKLKALHPGFEEERSKKMAEYESKESK